MVSVHMLVCMSLLTMFNGKALTIGLTVKRTVMVIQMVSVTIAVMI